MACGGCSRKRATSSGNLPYDLVFGSNPYLTDRQLKARLENFKRNYCKECNDRYTCDLSRFIECKGKK